MAVLKEFGPKSDWRSLRHRSSLPSSSLPFALLVPSIHLTLPSSDIHGKRRPLDFASPCDSAMTLADSSRANERRACLDNTIPEDTYTLFGSILVMMEDKENIERLEGLGIAAKSRNILV